MASSQMVANVSGRGGKQSGGQLDLRGGSDWQGWWRVIRQAEGPTENLAPLHLSNLFWKVPEAGSKWNQQAQDLERSLTSHSSPPWTVSLINDAVCAVTKFLRHHWRRRQLTRAPVRRTNGVVTGAARLTHCCSFSLEPHLQNFSSSALNIYEFLFFFAFGSQMSCCSSDIL